LKYKLTIVAIEGHELDVAKFNAIGDAMIFLQAVKSSGRNYKLYLRGVLIYDSKVGGM
jgi:hypothetical protein